MFCRSFCHDGKTITKYSFISKVANLFSVTRHQYNTTYLPFFCCSKATMTVIRKNGFWIYTYWQGWDVNSTALQELKSVEEVLKKHLDERSQTVKSSISTPFIDIQVRSNTSSYRNGQTHTLLQYFQMLYTYSQPVNIRYYLLVIVNQKLYFLHTHFCLC